MSLTSKGGNEITPNTEPEEYNASAGMVMAMIQYHIHSIYECDNKEQLTKYYHASLGSHPKTTLIEAAKCGDLRGCTGFDAKAIHKFIAVEDATKMGHLKQVQKGVRSTTTK